MALHSDTAVLDGLADDLDAGFAAFVRAHSGPVYSTALRLSGSRAEADDLAQETFVRAYRALRRFDAEQAARPGVAALAPHHHAEPVAQPPAPCGAPTAEQARGTPSVGGGRPAARAPRRPPRTSEESRLLVGLLGELPEHHRVPVVLRHVVGLSYAEIASTLDCPGGHRQGQRGSRPASPPGTGRRRADPFSSHRARQGGTMTSNLSPVRRRRAAPACRRARPVSSTPSWTASACTSRTAS